MLQFRYWPIGFALLLIAHLFCAEAHSADQDSITISIAGNSLKVPATYFPTRERALYSSTSKSDALRLKVALPDLTPFVDPEDNTPVFKRYRNELSVLVDVSTANSETERKKFFEKYESRWTRNRNKVVDQFRLQRYVLPAGTPSPVGDDDVYLSQGPEQDTTMIFCTPERFPDPESAVAEAIRHNGELVRNPVCSQIFFTPMLPNTLIRVSYFRRHLGEWSEIQMKVSRFLKGMLM